jgi:single-stranded-DNA-specific exonuclease
MGEKESRGSCRSIPEFHITRALDQCRELFVRHGGHAAAAGFTIETSKLPVLEARLFEIAERELGDQELIPTLSVDATVQLKDLSAEVFAALQKIQPHGYANPTPVFVSRNLSVIDARTVGADNSHLKLKVGEGQLIWDAIAFRFGAYAARLQRGARINLAYTFEENEWNGEKRFQLNVKDIKRAA